MITPLQTGVALSCAPVPICLFNYGSKKEFVSSLDPDQLALFKRVSGSRLVACSAAIAGGGFVAWALSRTLLDSCSASLAGAAAFYLIYRVWPKHAWMLDHLTSEKQVRAWLSMYKSMCVAGHVGLFIAAAGYLVALRSRTDPAPAP